ncbi:MAG TPA: hypothetical protein GX727_00230 [Clostridium sp.]|jgi:hypothetical protein|nr:hypothetical protein [Clostridium sp.]
MIIVRDELKFVLVGVIVLSMLLPLCATAQQQTDFFLQAEKYEVEVGKEFNVYVEGKDVEDIYAFELDVIFDSNKLELIKAAGTNEGYSSYNFLDEDKIHFVYTKIGDATPLKGDINLCQFTFKMLETSEASIELESIRIVSSEIIDTKVGDLESVESKYSFDDEKISVTGVLKSEEKEPPSSGNSGGTVVPSDDKDLDKEDKGEDKEDDEEDGEEIEEEPEEVPGAIVFTDIDNHWSKEFALKLVNLGVLTGYPDNTLRPDQKITRAEGVVLLVNTLELEFLDEGEIGFNDRDIIPAWCANHVKAASEKNILTGYEDNTLRPFNNLTRAEMVVLIMNAFGIEKAEFEKSQFADGDIIPGWAADFIAGAVKEGIVKGYPDNTFKPGNEVTRGEVFALIANCID